MPARIDEIDKLRKKRSRKAFIKRLVVFILIVALIFALFIGMRYASDYDIGGFISDTINGLGSGPGFPLDFAGNTVNALYPAKNAVALLTDTGLYIYKSDAKELSHTYFDYSSPVVVPAQNRFFIYDCFGYSYRIESKSATVLDKTLEDKVVCADYSRSGHYAVVTESARCLALLTVYDKNGTEIFSWTSTENYITGCALSPDGKNVAVAGLTTSGGMLRSVVVSFSLSSGNENFRKYYDNTLIYDLILFSKSRAYVIMENGAASISSNGTETQRFDYSGRTLTGYCRGEDGSFALIFPEDGSNGQNIVTLLDSECEERFTLRGINSVSGVYACQDGLYILNDSGISFYDETGALSGLCRPSADIYCFTLSGGTIYAATDSAIVTLELEQPGTASPPPETSSSGASLTVPDPPSASSADSTADSSADSAADSSADSAADSSADSTVSGGSDAPEDSVS